MYSCDSVFTHPHRIAGQFLERVHSDPIGRSLRQCGNFVKDSQQKKTTLFNRPEQSIHHFRVVHLLPMILAHGNIFYFLALVVGRFGHQPTRLLFHLFLGRQHNIKILPSSDNRILTVFQPMAAGNVT